MEILMVGPDLLHLSLRLMTDPSVSTKHKMILGSAVAYFISPIDLIPEALLGPFGYLDDIVILTFVLNHLLNDIPEELVERYWAGDTDLLNVLRGVIMGADRILGKGMIQRLRNHLKITE